MGTVLSKDVKEATNLTRKRNAEVAKGLGLNIDDCTTKELELAASKCIYPADEMEIHDEEGNLVWSIKAFEFYKQKAVPVTINPSLWLNGKGNSYAGVFEVLKDKIYQVRGFDIANLTIIRGKSGWIVQDVMTTIETSRAALELLGKALNEDVKNHISAIIISHSHSDHFGGVKGVVSEEQVGPASEGKIPIYVPEGFDEECVKENIFAGQAMGRRAMYQFGGSLEPGATGVVSTGLGLALPKGTSSFITPTNYICENGPVVIDGITVDFQLTPGTEAPTEMNNYFVEYRALWMAENCCGTLHNLYPIRGAQLRDSSGWADYILEAMVKFADKSDVVFQSHNWPHFNTEENPGAIRDYLLNNAAIYKYTHDQTLLYANEGFTAKEIARKVKIPEGLKFNWYARPYYGSLPINARAVFTKYLGFYTGTPNDIDPLTEVEDAKTFVEYAGSVEAVLNKAKEDFENGDYRRAAFAAEKVVLVEPQNVEARLLTADAFEQLGYVSESSVWRNSYLQGAYELRNGVKIDVSPIKKKNDLAQCMSSELLLKYIAILTDYEKTENVEFEFALNISEDTFGKEVVNHYIVKSHAGVLLVYKDENAKLEKYVTTSKAALFAIIGKHLSNVKDQIDTNCYEYLEEIEKNLVDIKQYADFNIIEP